MHQGKIYRTFYNSLIIHFYQIGFTNFLILRYEAFTVSTGNFQNMAASDLSAVVVGKYFHDIGILLHFARNAKEEKKKFYHEPHEPNEQED